MRAFSPGNLSFFLASALLVAMISSLGARAFSTARALAGRNAMARPFGPASSTARFLAAGAGDETSVVTVCTNKIREALETTEVTVTGAYDDPNGSHVSIEVVSGKFEGKRPLQRQQMVYKAIWEELQGPVHAVDSMVCKTPDEA
ncbi:unnamed protein product [Pseudo-nitzschia multistriata]|uniref:BolA-like protein n=1 Tax=Pseudo-nitzschia multistriata TaxID=183589 RepID=A0A448ZT52_9STRA|nr:unnamed protein product [Pseudo-nitzschia multistriata]